MVDLKHIVARNRRGEPCAIPSVCSAHPEVLRASLLLAQELDQPLVIEATSNQVNQDGGYTGMRPVDFISFVNDIADRNGVSRNRITFGGDHLGPQVWRNGPAETAMAKARIMVTDYVRAGFTKIHLDCSEGCLGEPAQVDDALAAARTADLAAAALAASDAPEDLIFVIGTEVPPPGGARNDEHGDIAPTTPTAAAATLLAHEEAFQVAGLADILPQVAGLVVQPGVEFSPMQVYHLPLQRDPGLQAALDNWPNLCLEAHSTDYQYPEAFIRLAELGFAFQKVGPALTFAYRQAVYALDALRQSANWASTEPLFDVMERVMLAEPGYWQGHYHGTSGDLRVERHFGLADRIRYYWPRPEASAAVSALLADLADRDLPDPLLRQGFDPKVIERARKLAAILPEALILAQIQTALMPYFLGKTPPPKGIL